MVVRTLPTRSPYPTPGLTGEFPLVTFNPVLAFIETDELDHFVAMGGNREVRYETDGFTFGYTRDGLFASFKLPDTVTDPSEREFLILEAEGSILTQLLLHANEDQDFETWVALQQLTKANGLPAGFFDCDGMD
jgi:hypothetical protein